MAFFNSTPKIAWRLCAAMLTACMAVATGCKHPVEADATRRLNLELYNFSHASEPQAQTDTLSRVEIDVDCGNNTWKITSKDDIFIPRNGKHAGKEGFEKGGAGGNVMTVPTFECEKASTGQQFMVVNLNIKEINPKYAYTKSEAIVTKAE